MKKKTQAIDPTLTLAGLARAYLDFIEKDGKSVSTCFAYCQELKIAASELGGETLVASLTAADIARFNNCKRVTKLKSGRPKSQLSIDKTRRVLRLALAYGEQFGLIAKSPIAAKADAETDATPAPTPAKKARKSRVVVEEREPVEAPPEAAPVETAA